MKLALKAILLIFILLVPTSLWLGNLVHKNTVRASATSNDFSIGEAPPDGSSITLLVRPKSIKKDSLRTLYASPHGAILKLPGFMPIQGSVDEAENHYAITFTLPREAIQALKAGEPAIMPGDLWFPVYHGEHSTRFVMEFRTPGAAYARVTLRPQLTDSAAKFAQWIDNLLRRF